MEGPLVKHNTSSSSAEYAKKVYCVLIGYTLFEFDSEAESRSLLWPRAEADVIGVSAAPSNSLALRSGSLNSSKGTELTFVYTTNAGERVCAMATSARECERWIVALTLGVELLLLSGLPEAAGGAGQCVAHEAPSPDSAAPICAASGTQFGYTSTRHMCAASGRAFVASQMAPYSLPLPGIGLAHAAKVSDACAQAQQLLNASRCRARLLNAVAHSAALETSLIRKYRTERKELWLRPLLGDEYEVGGLVVAGDIASSSSTKQQKVVDISIFDLASSQDAVEAAVAANAAKQRLKSLEAYHQYQNAVLLPGQHDVAALVAELHHLCALAEDCVPLSKKEMNNTSSTTQTQTQTKKVIVLEQENDDIDVPTTTKTNQEQARIKARSALVHSPTGRLAAVRDAVAYLLALKVADDDFGYREVCFRGRTLVFWLPQVAHVYYRQLPPRNAEAALRVTLLEELLLGAARRSFWFALRLAWTLAAYLEDRHGLPARRPHVLRLLVELEAAAAEAEKRSTQNSVDDDDATPPGDPWTLRPDTVAAAAMAQRGPVATEPSMFAGAVALELLPRAPAWLALELRRAAVALASAEDEALSRFSGGKEKKNFFQPRRRPPLHATASPPDDVLAREMRFVRALCDVAETMRGVELTQRPARLGVELRALPRRTPLGRAPFVGSTSNSKDNRMRLARVARVPPDEGHVFKTKARAPTLMLLETVDDDFDDIQAQTERQDSIISTDETRSLKAQMRSYLEPALEALQIEEYEAQADAAAQRRVASMPGILAAAAGDDDESDSLSMKDTSKSASRAKAKPPIGIGSSSSNLRRAASVNSGLAALPEKEVPITTTNKELSTTVNCVDASMNDDFKKYISNDEILAVASRSAARAEVARALKKKPALNLNAQRLARLDRDDSNNGITNLKEEKSKIHTNKASIQIPQRRPGFGEPWAWQRERIRKASPIGDEPSWNLVSLIVKSNDDLRQEVCALQIIAACNDAFEAAGLAGDDGGLWLRHYSIVPTGASTGIIETMADAVSLDSLKKAMNGASLATHFRDAHGEMKSAHGLTLGGSPPEASISAGVDDMNESNQDTSSDTGAEALAKARQNFISSMAAYSLVCYLLGLKDRHNGNILLDKFGHCIHIDFGFMLGQAPGGSFSLERVPFKLTTDHVDVMGGWGSEGFTDFVVLLACGFAALQAQADDICSVVEIMAKDSPFPCFRSGPAAVDKMRARLKLHLTTPEQVANHVAELVKQSFNAYGTRQYDGFQYLTNGIYS